MSHNEKTLSTVPTLTNTEIQSLYTTKRITEAAEYAQWILASKETTEAKARSFRAHYDTCWDLLNMSTEVFLARKNGIEPPTNAEERMLAWVESIHEFEKGIEISEGVVEARGEVLGKRKREREGENKTLRQSKRMMRGTTPRVEVCRANRV